LSSTSLITDLYEQISPAQFEKFLSILLDEMGFSDVAVTGRSGDRGIDLEATWTQKNVPGLEVDLAFKIQAKRLKPSSTLNPRYVRELRGTLASGEWGLLITTAKISSKTRQEGLNDSSRVISIIDGQGLIELCTKYGVGVKTNFSIDLSVLDAGEISPEVPEVSEKTPQEMLTQTLGEEFRRLGTSPIYKSESKTVIARSSKYYNRKDDNYWYGTKAVDMERVKKYGVSHFAYICSTKGVVLIPRKILLREIEKDNLNKSTTKEGQLIHYHIHLFERSGSIFWRLKTENKKIDAFFKHLD
jgi:hypothetical protein